MKYIFKTKDDEEAKILMMSSAMYSVLFELKYNFFRKWKHVDDTLVEGREEVLDELAEALKEIDI